MNVPVIIFLFFVGMFLGGFINVVSDKYAEIYESSKNAEYKLKQCENARMLDSIKYN